MSSESGSEEFRTELAELRAEVRSLGRQTMRRMEQIADDSYRQLEGLTNLYRQMDDLPILPRMRGWAVSPDVASEIYYMLVQQRPRHVIECGSGVSSVMLSRLVNQGVLESATVLEHDPLYFEDTSLLLERYGHPESINLVLAPLVDTEVHGETFQWYSVDVEQLPMLDIVFVDGPPTKIGPLSRYPAAARLKSRLSPGALMVLDDYARPDERETARRWQAEEEMSLVRMDLTFEKGFAVLSAAGSPETPKEQPNV